MYTFDSRVRYSEVGVDGNLTIESLIDYFQDCTTFNSEDIGLGVDYLNEVHMVWMLSSWQICVNRYPHLCERIVIGTAPYEFKGFLGYRNFEMKTIEGEVLAYANSIWTLMDIQKMIPAKPNERILNGYALEAKYPMEYAPRKIAIPDGGKDMEPYTVKQHHLDTNNHVNNGQYVRMAMECIPKDFCIKQLRVEYKSQAKLGDVVCPVVAESESGKIYTVSLNKEDGKPYSIVEMTGGVI